MASPVLSLVATTGDPAARAAIAQREPVIRTEPDEGGEASVQSVQQSCSQVQ